MQKALNFLLAKRVALFVLVSSIFVLVYFPAMNAGLFSTDDNASFVIPQLENPGLQSLKAIFTPGTHADFYPVRDLSYLVDNLLWKHSWFLMRLHQVAIMAGISVLLMQILLAVGVPSTWGLALSVLWAFHPFHAETLLWLTSRKDLLALMFGLLSIHFAISPPSHSRLLAAIACFVLSLGAKASLILLPFALIIPAWRSKNKMRIGYLTAACFLGILSGLFQTWFYTAANPMSVHWEWPLRIQSSGSALGRLSLGWFFPSLNAIDIDNFGEWIDYNSKFFLVGVMAWLGLFIATAYNFKKKNFVTTSVCLGIWLVYLPISGLVFEHINFYSVRYFEPVGLGVVLLIGLWIKSRGFIFNRIGQSVFLLVLAAELFLAHSEASIWSENIRIREKALNNSPSSVGLRAALLGDMITNTSLRADLASQCEREGADREIWFTNCHAYFRYGYLVMKSQKNLEAAARYLEWYKKSRAMFVPLPRVVERLEADYALAKGEVDKSLIEKWSRMEKFFLTEDYRWLHLVFSCFDDPARALEQFNRWEEDRLLSITNLQKFMEGLEENTRNKVALCFPKVGGH